MIGTGEYASQSDYKDADNFSPLNYTLIEGVLSFKTGVENIAPITIKVGIETLEGDVDEGESFITPFATKYYSLGAKYAEFNNDDNFREDKKYSGYGMALTFNLKQKTHK